jgi:hypothetical protein
MNDVNTLNECSYVFIAGGYSMDHFTRADSNLGGLFSGKVNRRFDTLWTDEQAWESLRQLAKYDESRRSRKSLSSAPST